MSKPKSLPPIHTLNDHFNYDPTSGSLTWKKVSKFSRYRLGALAGTSKPSDYLRVKLKGFSYPAHRIIWAIYYGAEPTKTIDHINGDVLDNRITNLREADVVTQGKNRKRNHNNLSGCTGVCFYKAINKWSAYIKSNNKSIHLGHFIDKAEAIKTRKDAEQVYGFHANHDR